MSRDADMSHTGPESIDQRTVGSEGLDPHTFERYLRGETSSEVSVEIERWLRIEPGRWERYESFRQNLTPRLFPGYSFEEKTRRVDRIVDAVSTSARPHTERRGARTGGSRDRAVAKSDWRLSAFGWSGAAVALLVCVAFLGAGWWSGVHRVNSALSTQRSMYATGNGERARITLPDGSTVLLNVGSRLEVPANYAVDNRAVHLVGEALFTVTHHASAPFTVSAGTSTTRVLGTTFSVRHYLSDSLTRIAVQDGRVSVQSVIVSAQQEVTVAGHTVSAVQPTNPGNFTFTQGVLTLDERRLEDAIVELNRWYNADIRLGDPSLADRLIGGRFGAGSLTDLVEYLEWTFNLRVERNGQRLTLYNKS